jgi:exonuclease III
MPHIIKIMTLNINAITSHTKTRMLEDLLRRQDIDIALLQETTIPTTIHSGATTHMPITGQTNAGPQ